MIDRSRKGVAATEFAVIAPVLILVVFGAIEVTHYISLKQAATRIGHAAAADVILTDDSYADIEQKSEQLASDVGIAGASITISNAADNLASVDVSVPLSANAIILNFFQGVDANAQSFVYRGDRP